jgi:hypothetical protein
VRVVAVVLLALALGLGLKSLAVDSPAAGGSGPELAPVSVTSVDVSAAALVGKPAVEARDVLAGAGLVPQLVADGSGQAVGLVSGVEPAGAVPAGSTVVVHVVPEPPAEADDDDDEPRAGTDEAAGEDEPSERGKRKGRGR